ncbi:MAG: ATP-binding protein, partial [Schleiferiaceae bacterium]|nr:ATP-binding protein [Schleiferiaceae bacterium]
MQREESGTLEFKLRIDSQQKIAKTLVAFANGEGGRIAIGVRDNGSVAGCNVEEEFHMIEGAA